MFSQWSPEMGVNCKMVHQKFTNFLPHLFGKTNRQEGNLHSVWRTMEMICFLFVELLCCTDLICTNCDPLSIFWRRLTLDLHLQFSISKILISLTKNFVANDQRVCWNSFAVLIPVPCPYRSCAVLDVQQSMAETGFPKCWVIGLRLCVTKTQKNSMLHFINKFTEKKEFGRVKILREKDTNSTIMGDLLCC